MTYEKFVNQIHLGDCRELLPVLPPESIHLCLSDIPYGISLDSWDVLHQNTNSALLGSSPAQAGKNGFKKRGKPIRGWCAADGNILSEYQDWCRQWADNLFPLMIDGASVFIFGARRTIHRAIIALEDAGFLLRDILIWKKASAHHRSQSLSTVFRKRGENDHARVWNGWRLGNLAPIYEPIAWLFKPYKKTITDNVLEYNVGAMNVAACLDNGKSPTNMLDMGFSADENRVHEAQKPISVMSYLIRLTTRQEQVVLDPFIGSGTTAVACHRLNRRFIGIEKDPHYHNVAERRLVEERMGG